MAPYSCDSGGVLDDVAVAVEAPLEDILGYVVPIGAGHVGHVDAQVLARHVVDREVKVCSQHFVAKLVHDESGGRLELKNPKYPYKLCKDPEFA